MEGRENEISEMEGNANIISYDILEWFPILFCQDVFKYLRGKFVMQASVVNKEWNKFCAESAQSGKLKLVFHRNNIEKLSNEGSEILKNSKRTYQHIECNGISIKPSDKILSVIEKGTWKSVSLKTCSFDSSVLPRILGVVGTSVQELEIANPIPFEYLDRRQIDLYPGLLFPKLKTLNYSGPGNRVLELLERCIGLVAFNGFVEQSEAGSVVEILSRNPNLKEVSTSIELWLAASHLRSFKLQKLKVNSHFGGSSLQLDNRMLEGQAPSLESLYLGCDFTPACLEFMLASMPRLRSITTFYNHLVGAISNRTAPLPVNKTITSFEFYSKDNQIPLQTMLRALSSLKHFKCKDLDNKTFQSLAVNSPGLESIECDFLTVTVFPKHDFFPSLKQFTVAWIDIDDNNAPTSENKFSQLVRQEMRRIAKQKEESLLRNKVSSASILYC